MPSDSTQNFKNHAKFDPPFHFFMAPVFLANFIVSIVHCYHQPSYMSGWLIVVALAAFVAVFKIRIYALKVQDRLIRLEERLRLSALMPEAQQPVLDALSEKQLVALRFAPNVEAPALAARAVSQKMAPKEIKSAIVNWRADYFRI